MSAEPTRLTAEFTVEPFDPGQPGPHVEAAIAAVQGSGVAEVEIGPFGTVVRGPAAEVLAAVAAASEAAVAAGATRVSTQIDRLDG